MMIATNGTVRQSASSAATAPGFSIKKSIVSVSAIIHICGCVIIIAICDYMVDQLMNNNNNNDNNIDDNYHQKTLDTSYKSSIKLVVYAVAVLSLIIHLIGLIGAIKEHYCMTVGYLVVQILEVIHAVKLVNEDNYYPWYMLLIETAVCLISFSYARDLHRRRRRRPQQSLSADALPNISSRITNTTTTTTTNRYVPTDRQWRPLLLVNNDQRPNGFTVDMPPNYNQVSGGGGGQQSSSAPPSYNQLYNNNNTNLLDCVVPAGTGRGQVYNEKSTPLLSDYM
ncbi:uncharacterized protein LOC128954239 [Oppia nitens]|uniref:uncharacterized protein LOC128954239 n=1 Tax=Oppia nitens TaxID=1686743 RepID=UPI0023DC53C9|nr:uncharacterized protein LOC128954239 [Oppia nitens]